jgi:phenylalanyl-tRNA synthetase beta chain
LPEHPNARGEPWEVHECALVLAQVPPAKGARFDAGALAQLRSVVEDLVRALKLEPIAWSADDGAASWAHAGQALRGTIGDGSTVAGTNDGRTTGRGATDSGTTGSGTKVALRAAVHLAVLDPRVRRDLGLTGELESDVACALISIDALLEAPARAGGYAPIPKFPSVKVDVALAVPRDTQSGALVAAIEKSGKGLVHDVELFDVYTGDKLGPDKKSLAYHVHLQSDQKTLGEAEVQKFLERLERELGQIGAELRKV